MGEDLFREELFVWRGFFDMYLLYVMYIYIYILSSSEEKVVKKECVVILLFRCFHLYPE